MKTRTPAKKHATIESAAANLAQFTGADLERCQAMIEGQLAILAAEEIAGRARKQPRVALTTERVGLA